MIQVIRNCRPAAQLRLVCCSCLLKESNVDSRCQPFLARRGPVVHCATKSNETSVVICVDEFPLIHDVNPSQLGEAQWCISPIQRREALLREALLSARRGPVVHRVTKFPLRWQRMLSMHMLW